MSIKIDMEGVSAGGLEPLPAGVYDAVVAAVKYHPSSQSSGQPYVEFEFTLPDHAGRKQWRNYSLQPQALWALKQTLVRLGVEVPDGELELEPSDLIGLPCRLQIEVKPHYRDPDREDNDVTELLEA